MAGFPAAVISATVLAPERQTIRSARANIPGMSSMNGKTSAGSPRAQVSRLGVIIVALAGLVDDVKPGNCSVSAGERVHHGFVDGVRALAAAEDQQCWRTSAGRGGISKNARRTGTPVTWQLRK